MVSGLLPARRHLPPHPQVLASSAAARTGCRKRYRAGRSALVVFEGLFALYFAACTVYALWAGMWASLPFLYLFLQGYGTMFLLAVLPRLRRPSPRRFMAATEPS